MRGFTDLKELSRKELRKILLFLMYNMIHVIPLLLLRGEKNTNPLMNAKQINELSDRQPTLSFKHLC